MHTRWQFQFLRTTKPRDQSAISVELFESLWSISVTRSLHCMSKAIPLKKMSLGTSLAVQWLRLRTSTAGGMGSIPGWGTKISLAAQLGKINKIFLNSGRNWVFREEILLADLGVLCLLSEMLYKSNQVLKSRWDLSKLLQKQTNQEYTNNFKQTLTYTMEEIRSSVALFSLQTN